MMRSLIKLRDRGAAAALWLGTITTAAAGQQIPTRPLRYRIGWQDAAVAGGTGVAAGVATLFASHLPHATCAPCDPGGLWGIDRPYIGEPRSGPERASSAAMVAVVFAGAALTLDAHRGQPGPDKWEDLAVYGQALAVNTALTAWTKVLFHRPRPSRYTSNATLYTGVDEGLSFPSGHTSIAFTAAAAYLSMQTRRHTLKQHIAESVLLFGTATATGILRVAARKHFPTDVMAGAVLGTTVGWFIPRLHPLRR